MKYIVKLMAVILIIIIIALVIFNNNDLNISRYRITTNKINSEINVVQISDLHNDLYNNNQDELVDEIVDEKPDLIVITGDIMYEKASLENTEKLLEKINTLAPVFYVTGNHEYRDEKLEELFKLLNKYHIKSLLDESVIINIKGNKIRISGLDDAQGDEYWQRQSSEAQRLASLKKEDEIFHILLSHRPNLAKEYANNNFDLVFCGHAHGGQVRIPNIINGLVAPNQGLLPRYTKGVYKLNDKTTMVVSAGLIRNKVPRINNQPELVVATIDSKGE